MSVSAAALGGLAAMTASTITHPADSLKVLSSMHGEGRTARGVAVASLVRDVYRSEGLRKGLYRGVSATWLRQALFSPTRFGVNDAMQRKLSGGKSTKDLGVAAKLASAAVAGTVGATLSCPADTVLVRMQADGRLPLHERRGYRNVFDGLRRITADEGVSTLYRGLRPLVIRGCLVTAGQFTTYDVMSRQLRLRGWKDGVRAHLVASTVAGTVSSLIVQPLEVIKNRMMQSRAVPQLASTTLMTYKGDWDCVVKTWRFEGIRGFYKGLPATFMRQCPQVVLMWVILEQYRRIFAMLTQ
eukprot:TRINITY_DN359_c0_g2_i1.p2 TRINITY_DN359_c0_g2~~TRINITY_DN359_c0_g2_i1.p2  ORF type:complete len:328 (+),score=111.73 TRINITY_DN359_c0_g2_i1:88-984(+)